MARGPVVCAIVLGAGSGSRAGQAKQFRRVGGRSLLYHACAPLTASPEVGGLIVVVPRGREVEVTAELDDAGVAKLLAVVPGGATRSASARAGLAALPDACTIVLIHDAARPFASRQLVGRVVRAARRHGAAIPVLPVADSIVELRAVGTVRRYLAREVLAAVQTPQGFSRRVLLAAFARRRRLDFTDDASVVHAVGGKGHVVRGELGNRKITTAEELDAAVRRLEGGA
jgi:2-C-methyl-D-erythritol 4-phosphate cytidylyltransferase/2-C-methyl-D-erythritol 2,4-cyclodiphosphate synthase